MAGLAADRDDATRRRRRVDSRLVYPALGVWGTSAVTISAGSRQGVVAAVGLILVGAALLARQQRTRLLHPASSDPITGSVIGAAACCAVSWVRSVMTYRTIHHHWLVQSVAHSSRSTQLVTGEVSSAPIMSAGSSETAYSFRFAVAGLASDVRVFCAQQCAQLQPGTRISAYMQVRSAGDGPVPLTLRLSDSALSSAHVAGERSLYADVVMAIRSQFWQLSGGSLSGEYQALFYGMVLGDTSHMSAHVRNNFYLAGLSHLTAVSGSNVAIVTATVMVLTRSALRWMRLILVVVTIVGFALLIGPDPSVVRASIVALITVIAIMLGRARHALAALSAAVIVMVVVSPTESVAPGFILSVVATGGLVILGPRLVSRMDRRGIPQWIGGPIAVCVAAEIATFPALALLSGRVSGGSLIANLAADVAVVPITTLGVGVLLATLLVLVVQGIPAVLGLSLVAVSVMTVARWLSIALCAACWPCLWWLISVARAISQIQVLDVYFPSSSSALWWVGMVLVAVGVTLRVRAARNLRGVLLHACVAGTAVVLVGCQMVKLGQIDPSEREAAFSADRQGRPKSVSAVQARWAIAPGGQKDAATITTELWLKLRGRSRLDLRQWRSAVCPLSSSQKHYVMAQLWPDGRWRGLIGDEGKTSALQSGDGIRLTESQQERLVWCAQQLKVRLVAGPSMSGKNAAPFRQRLVIVEKDDVISQSSGEGIVVVTGAGRSHGRPSCTRWGAPVVYPWRDGLSVVYSCPEE